MKPKMFRPKLDRVIGGVCSGIAYHFDVDPIFLRVLFFILIWSPIPIFTIYVLLWLFTPADE